MQIRFKIVLSATLEMREWDGKRKYAGLGRKSIYCEYKLTHQWFNSEQNFQCISPAV